MTISSMSSSYYSMYQLNSDYSSELEAMESEYSSETYGLSSVSNALETMTDTDDNQFMTISSAYSYAKSQLTLSQLSDYETLTEEDETYEISGISNVSSYAASSSQYEALVEAYTSEDSYSSYMSDVSGSLFDTLL